jgi:hypothetical protein
MPKGFDFGLKAGLGGAKRLNLDGEKVDFTVVVGL